MRLFNAVKNDIIFQFRHGFYLLYAFFCFFYILLLYFLNGTVKEIAFMLIIFLDISFLGFFFIGGVILMEKDQDILEYLFVIPFRIYEYILSKVVSLGVLSLLMSVVIMIVGFGLIPHIHYFVIAVILTSTFFTLLGFPLLSRIKNVNGYLINSILITTPFVLPVVTFFFKFDHPVLYVFPTHGSLMLLNAAFKGISPFDLVLSIVSLGAWIIIAYTWGYTWFKRYVVVKSEVTKTKRPAAAPVINGDKPVAVKSSAGKQDGTLIGLLKGDAKNFYRDSTLVMMLVAPVLIIVVFKFGLPYLTTVLSRYTGFDLSPYHPFIISFMTMIPAMMFGMLVGFITLDERDENILAYISVTPLSKSFFLIYRMLIPVTASFFYFFIHLYVIGLVDFSVIKVIPIALMVSLEGPCMALFMVGFAKNKVEGLAMGKLLGVFYLAPIAGYFIKSDWKYLAGISPPFWVTGAFLAESTGLYLMHVIAGFVVHGVFIALLLSIFKRKVG